MGDLFRKISEKLRSLGGVAKTTPPLPERRRAPRFICCTKVLWEVGRESGEGLLREVSSTGLRLRSDRAFLAGKHIRVRPLAATDAAPLSTDVAIGTVVYSRRRTGGYEVGVEFINPERISRFAWIGQLVRGPKGSVIPQAEPHQGTGLKLIHGGADSLPEGFSEPK